MPVNAGLTLIRDPAWDDEDRATIMIPRRNSRAINRGAVQALPGAVLILGGLLLLISP
jgi:hypothetical protein